MNCVTWRATVPRPPDPASRREHRGDSRGLPDLCAGTQPVQFPSLYKYLPVHTGGPRVQRILSRDGWLNAGRGAKALKAAALSSAGLLLVLQLFPTAALIARLARQANRGADHLSPGARRPDRFDSIDLFLRSRRGRGSPGDCGKLARGSGRPVAAGTHQCPLSMRHLVDGAAPGSDHPGLRCRRHSGDGCRRPEGTAGQADRPLSQA